MIFTQVIPQYSTRYLKPSNIMIDQSIRIVKKFYGKLYDEGEKVNQLFFLIEGKVLRYKRNEQGRRVKLPSIESGGLLEPQILGNINISSHSARVCKPSKLLVIPHTHLRSFIKNWPALKKHIISELICQIDLLSTR